MLETKPRVVNVLNPGASCIINAQTKIWSKGKIYRLVLHVYWAFTTFRDPPVIHILVVLLQSSNF